MKRFSAVLSLAAAFVVTSVGIALAKSDYPPSPEPTHRAHVAFTGANVSLGLVIMGALLAVGVAALVVGRLHKRASE